MTTSPSDLTNSPSTERRRSRLIEELGLLSLNQAELLERVAHAVRIFCNVPMANVSLLHGEAQCIIGEKGMNLDRLERNQTFCTRALADHEFLVVENALEDERFAETKYVEGPPYIRFYAGMPIVLDGVSIGTLCALDDEPREITILQRARMSRLVRLLEGFFAVIQADSLGADSEKLASQIVEMGAEAAIVQTADGRNEEQQRALNAMDRLIFEMQDSLLESISFEEPHSLAFPDTEVDEA